MLRDLFASLAPFKPLVAGTYPLGIHTETSDLDVICEAPDLAAFEEAVRTSFAHAPGFAVRHVACEPPAIVASFTVEGLAIEVFGQSLPTYEQHAFRHLLVEARLLRLADAALRDDVVARKRAGAATEPAFAAALGLSGDPFDAVLALESRSDAELGAVVTKAGFGLRARPSATPDVSAPAEVATDDGASTGFDWNRVFTDGVPNPRMAEEELEHQLDALSAEFSMAEKMEIARRLRMKVESVRLNNPVTEFGLPDEVLSLYRWCNGGEFEIGQRRFSPILRMHEIRTYMIEYAIPHFMPTCIPLAVDGKGNCYFLDLSTKPSPWVRFGPIERLGMRDKFRLLVDNFEGMFLDASDPSEW